MMIEVVKMLTLINAGFKERTQEYSVNVVFPPPAFREESSIESMSLNVKIEQRNKEMKFDYGQYVVFSIKQFSSIIPKQTNKTTDKQVPTCPLSRPSDQPPEQSELS